MNDYFIISITSQATKVTNNKYYIIIIIIIMMYRKIGVAAKKEAEIFF